MAFPKISGKTINGDRRYLPRDFSAPLNVVLLAFTQAHQYDVDSWTPQLNELKAQRGDLDVYELPTLPRMNPMMRWMTDYWMSNGISDPVTREHTITLYTDVGAFLRALALPNTTEIYTLLVDRDGGVHWRTTGPYRADKFTGLLGALQTMPHSV